MSEATSAPLDVLGAVQARYRQGARERVSELCCPVDYDTSLLKVLPREILERDYGCGDPSRFVRKGDVVLDLGSGAGKICYLASQLVGREGRVIGVDATPEMLSLARKYAGEVGTRIGWHNVEFRHGLIQDLRLDRDALALWLEQHPVHSLADMDRLRTEQERLRQEAPLVADSSVDLVLSNCVLNLVESGAKQQLFQEIERVLRRGGRCAISDIVSDEEVPEHLRRDPALWSGCISGAMREDLFLQAFADAGLHGIEISAYQTEPWAVVDGIEFRAVTVVAHKGKQGACWEHNEAVVYKGPWKQVVDDDGHVLRRGERSAVCRKTFELLTREPYAASVIGVQPLVPIAPADARAFECHGTRTRAAEETKHGVLRADVAPGTEGCVSDGACC
ncbi:MAG: methyltransferase domain-containing protein [Planctomycetes bacterium]|nr:methyltransferase domain-containing protein [Planctomycetota bacterium]